MNWIGGKEKDKVFLEKMNEVIEENVKKEEVWVELLGEKVCMRGWGLFVKMKGVGNRRGNEMIEIMGLKKGGWVLVEKE